MVWIQHHYLCQIPQKVEYFVSTIVPNNRNLLKNGVQMLHVLRPTLKLTLSKKLTKCIGMALITLHLHQIRTYQKMSNILSKKYLIKVFHLQATLPYCMVQ